jgi:pimeloyl-ACP methyl ester carboxylesterase
VVQWARNLTLSNPHPQPPEAFARQLRAAGSHDTRHRLASLTMPVHVIGAGHDILVPVWKSREIAELIPGSRFTVLEGAAHGVQFERPEEFNAAVLEFLAETAPAPAAS